MLYFIHSFNKEKYSFILSFHSKNQIRISSWNQIMIRIIIGY